MKQEQSLYILNQIPFKLNLDEQLESQRLIGKQRLITEFTDLVKEAETLAKPKALFLKLDIADRGEDHIIIAEKCLTSRVLSVNLAERREAYPALATCGTEIDEWANSKTNMLHQFWAKSIANAALGTAIAAVETSLHDRYNIQMTSLMTPGSLIDWPISQQTMLFDLFGDAARKIGVSLNDSFLMTPLSTVSCLMFESETRFFSCQLCPKTDCQSRRAAFEEHLFTEKYALDPNNVADTDIACHN
jgi:hypothetical protein